MVSDMPGTTRDAIDARADLASAAVPHRRHGRACGGPGGCGAAGQVELVSVAGAKKAIVDADVVVLRDRRGGGRRPIRTPRSAARPTAPGRGVVIVANKWDLVKSPDPDFVKTFDDELRRKMKFLDYAPILHISALTGERAPKVLETIDKVAAVAPEARPDAGAQQVRRGRSPRPIRRSARAAGTCASCTRRRSASRRRRSCSSRTWRRRSTSPTSGSWSTSSASSSASSARRSGSRCGGERSRSGPHGRGASSICQPGARDHCQRRTPADLLAILPRLPTMSETSTSGRDSQPRAVQGRRGVRPRQGAARTCCGRGKRSFPIWACRRPKAARASIGAPTSSRSCASSTCCSSRG